MKLLKPFGWAAPKIRVFVRDTSVTTGVGLAGVVYNSTGLVVDIIGSETATAIHYKSAATATIEDVTAIGTYQAPSANCCRVAPVDNTNLPGLLEIHFSAAIFAVAGRQALQGVIKGVANMEPVPFEIQLTPVDLFDTGLGFGIVSYGTLASTATHSATKIFIPSGQRADLGPGDWIKPAGMQARQLTTTPDSGTGEATVDPAFTSDPAGVAYMGLSTAPGTTSNGVPVSAASLLAALATDDGLETGITWRGAQRSLLDMFGARPRAIKRSLDD